MHLSGGHKPFEWPVWAPEYQNMIINSAHSSSKNFPVLEESQETALLPLALRDSVSSASISTEASMPSSSASISGKSISPQHLNQLTTKAKSTAGATDATGATAGNSSMQGFFAHNGLRFRKKITRSLSS